METNKSEFITQPSQTKATTANTSNSNSSRTSVDQNETGSSLALQASKWLVRKGLSAMGKPEIFVTLPDGATIYVTEEQPKNGMTIRNRRAMWRFMTNPRLYFGEEFAAGNIQISGDLVEFIKASLRNRQQFHEKNGIDRAISRVRRFRQRHNSLTYARSNIHHHYDVGNDFFKLWLDKDMVYTCAYFPTPEASLEQAQFAKLDYICRKLRLQPGETVVEAGCGWGALALHMAKYYGVRVKAFNISHQQILEARNRAKNMGLQDQVEFIEDDYRNISGKFDALVSVGMLEHVGRSYYREFSEVIDGCLTERGRGLIHSIGQNEGDPTDPWTNKHIFPGADLPTLGEMMGVLEPTGFTILDVENIGLHYAKTLQHWLERFDSHEAEIRDMYDDYFVRTWRLYLAGAMVNFILGDMVLYQVAFTRPSNNDIPLTRAYLYSDNEDKDRDDKALKRATFT